MQLTVTLPSGPHRLAVVGTGERNLKLLREALGVSVSSRDDIVRLEGDRDAALIARGVLERLGTMADDGRAPLDRRGVLDLIGDEADRQRDAARKAEPGDAEWSGRLEVYTSGGRAIQARTENQRKYLAAIRKHDLVFGIGPAGTGKTYLAVAAAVDLLRQDRISKIVLVRPAVEAGEKLGFLPGGLEDKVNPYLRPLFDALHEMMDPATTRQFLRSDIVEVAPLAFMRGRTLNHALVILDEAQNTTKGQMKMFLTRMGQDSKMVVTGDTTQIDLPDPAQSGLVDAVRRLRGQPGVAFVELAREDVVRHQLVQTVVNAYGEEERELEHARVIHDLLDGAPADRDPNTQADTR